MNRVGQDWDESRIRHPQADFALDLLAVQESPPARLPRMVGYVTGALFASLAFGQLRKIISIAPD